MKSQILLALLIGFIAADELDVEGQAIYHKALGLRKELRKLIDSISDDDQRFAVDAKLLENEESDLEDMVNKYKEIADETDGDNKEEEDEDNSSVSDKDEIEANEDDEIDSEESDESEAELREKRETQLNETQSGEMQTSNNTETQIAEGGQQQEKLPTVSESRDGRRRRYRRRRGGRAARRRANRARRRRRRRNWLRRRRALIKRRRAAQRRNRLHQRKQRLSMLKQIQEASDENKMLKAKLEAIRSSSRHDIEKAVQYKNGDDKPEVEETKIEKSNENEHENEILSKEETEVSSKC
ncbi:hypothetical protein WR25_10166 [Diploscapter pachys]|uniref:BZIP domain-containing protein n=1 Tax=Diploscapter pachys TaxID=2018661 RepID=A0A2A2KM21_9BILA|nr:hypothetical protein WR25_10166 [Diploscapter pachys]